MGTSELRHLPGVLDWLRFLRDHGPSRRMSGKAGAKARDLGYTDFWVQHRPTGQMMPLEDAKALVGQGSLVELVDYGNGEENLTQAGRDALADFLR